MKTDSFYILVEGKGLQWFFEPEHIVAIKNEIEALESVIKVLGPSPAVVALRQELEDAYAKYEVELEKWHETLQH
jgi:hypothetical protein